MPLTQAFQLIVLQPQGRLDLQGGKNLEKQLVELVARPDDLWVVNFAQVDFIDSFGLIALAKGLKTARQSGCRLVFCNLPAPVRLVFELTQLDSTFEIFESYDAVLTTVKPVIQLSMLA